ncbi:hypothetical protein YC2023_036936 [Brassica napus]
MGETLYSDVIYVAVNQYVPESELNLLWTLKTLRVKKLCLLQVLIPFSPNPLYEHIWEHIKETYPKYPSNWNLTFFVYYFVACGLSKSEIKAIQDSELKTSYDSLYKYRDICSNEGVNEKDVGISLVSGYDVGEEIVKLINQNNIKKLVMGAAANPHYSRGMSITSRKAEYVSQHAPTRCKIWFICKGKLIKTRDPLVAADGFTYEAKNIRYWLNVGNNTSPQTGARLAHRDLTPNYTLRSLIMDWLQHHPNYKH